MNAFELSNRLFDARVPSRDAADIISWLAELYNYNRIQGLATLEDVYKERSEEWTESPMSIGQYKNYIAYLRRIIKEQDQTIATMKILHSIAIREFVALPKEIKMGVVID